MSNFVQLEINKKNRWVYFTRYRWVAHAIYWLWVLIAGTLMIVKVPLTFSVILNHFILDNLLFALFLYIYCLYFIPYYFKRNKNLQFWLLVVFSYLAISALDVFYNKTFVTLTYTSVPVHLHKGFMQSYVANLGGYLINFLIFSMMLFFMEKNEENHTLSELEKEKKEIEQVKLDLLKTNISPDFLMRSLSQLKQSAIHHEETTPEAILTFSDLLRYRLYRGRQQTTPLSEELLALQNFIHFIALKQIKSDLLVELNIQGDAEGKHLAPLSLINLLEPFCKINTNRPVNLQMILLIEETELILEMDYHMMAPGTLIADLNDYGANYKQLYGGSIKFQFENCEDDRCSISLSLPLSVM